MVFVQALGNGEKAGCISHLAMWDFPNLGFWVADYVKGHPELGKEPIDIEDLVNIGRSEGPYVH